MKQSIINEIALLNDNQESFESFKKQLQNKFPDFTNHEIEYWSSRLILLGANPNDRWELKCNDWDEPTKIEVTIILYPTYGS